MARRRRGSSGIVKVGIPTSSYGDRYYGVIGGTDMLASVPSPSPAPEFGGNPIHGGGGVSLTTHGGGGAVLPNPQNTNNNNNNNNSNTSAQNENKNTGGGGQTRGGGAGRDLANQVKNANLPSNPTEMQRVGSYIYHDGKWWLYERDDGLFLPWEVDYTTSSKSQTKKERDALRASRRAPDPSIKDPSVNNPRNNAEDDSALTKVESDNANPASGTVYGQGWNGNGKVKGTDGASWFTWINANTAPDGLYQPTLYKSNPKTTKTTAYVLYSDDAAKRTIDYTLASACGNYHTTDLAAFNSLKNNLTKVIDWHGGASASARDIPMIALLEYMCGYYNTPAQQYCGKAVNAYMAKGGKEPQNFYDGNVWAFFSSGAYRNYQEKWNNVIGDYISNAY